MKSLQNTTFYKFFADFCFCWRHKGQINWSVSIEHLPHALMISLHISHNIPQCTAHTLYTGWLPETWIDKISGTFKNMDSNLTVFGPGEGGNWPIARFCLYNSKTIQQILSKCCEFNYTYIGYLSKLTV